MGKVNRFTDIELSNVIKDYNSGMTPKDLGLKYNRNPSSIINKLKSIGLYVCKNYKYTEDDIDFLKDHYASSDWDLIFSRFPHFNNSKQSLYTKMSKLNITTGKYHFWSDEELAILKENYYTKSLGDLEKIMNFQHNQESIRRKAFKYFGYSKDNSWTKEEYKIIQDYYSNISLDDICKMIPNRTRKSIITHASELNKMSYDTINFRWSDDEINYLINNWKTIPDELLAVKLGKNNRHSIADKRHQLGLLRQNGSIKNYESISKYLRGNIYLWKQESMKKCNYKCIFTGSKKFEIHHLYGVSNILKDVFVKFNIEEKDNYCDYSDKELSFILEKYINEQQKYPLGVCVSKYIHVLFHSMYGQYYNTPEQWYQFEKDFKNGVYNEYIKQKQPNQLFL